MNLLKRFSETHDEVFRAAVSKVHAVTPKSKFYIKKLAGHGDDYFNDEWWVQVTEAGGASEGEWQNVTDYTSSTGLFTVGADFTANIEVGDEFIFIHEYQYALGARDDAALGVAANDDNIHSVISMEKGIIDRAGNLNDAAPAMNAAPGDTDTLVEHVKALRETVGQEPLDNDDSLHTSIGQRDAAATADDLSDIATTTAQSKLRRLLLRFSANAFSATIQGSARTDVETMFGELATYFVASGGAFADKVNNKTLRTNLEDILQDFFLTVGCDGANEFKTTIQAAAATQTTIEAALDALATYFSASGAVWGVQQNNQTSRTNLEQVWEDYLAVVGVDGTNVLTNINNVAAATFNAQNQAFATLWGADGANAFDPTIQGATKANLDLALEALADYNAASGAAISVQMNNQTARTNFEAVWEDLITLIGVPTTTQLTNINNSANVTFDAIWQKFATLWAADGANAFNPTIQGGARTDLETALNNLATYFSAAAAAMSLQVNNQTARTNLEQALEDYFTVIGCDGTNVFNPTIDGTARTTLDTALQALWDGIQNGGVKNVMINRDMPYLTEFWETEALAANKWEETLDGAGTGTFTAVADEGVMLYRLLTGALANNDAILNSKYRWMVIPSMFGDTDTPMCSLSFEFQARFTNEDLTSNQYVTLGFTEAKNNDNDAAAGNDIAAFIFKATDTLSTRTSVNGVDEDNDVSSGIVLTDLNRFKIVVGEDEILFYINGTLVATHNTTIPNMAMYLLFGTRPEGAAATTLDVSGIRAWYGEVV
jgi:DNA-binding protein Fis